ncbi:MAG: hypothetical protein GY854_07765, partial [Deltaproteobacteria bacterium]|nr:hypothetical protein [Deltaproteobacteria bacterium]
MGWRESGVTTILAGTLLLALIYAYLYRQHKRSFLGLWALAWISSTVHYSFRLAIDIVGLSSPLYFVCQMMSLTTSMCILWGAFVFAGKSSHRGWLVVVHVVVLWMGIMVFSESAAWLMIPVSLFVGYAYVRAGIVFLGLRDIGGPAPVITGISFMLVGVMKAGEPLHPELSWLDTWNYRVAAILGVFMAVGMLLVYFEKMRSEAAEGELRYRLLAENARDVIFRCRVFPSMKIEY